jgi:hypothetical protein
MEEEREAGLLLIDKENDNTARNLVKGDIKDEEDEEVNAFFEQTFGAKVVPSENNKELSDFIQRK